jgi:DNA polymerase I-like protein with 3'-5' exonuclease and polymerase domains
MVDIATITAAIAAATSGVGLIDKIADQISRFIRKDPTPVVPKEYRMKISKEGDTMVSKIHGQENQRITFEDFAKLPESDLRHIKVLEKSMENHYAIWASVYPTLALAVDPIAKAKTEQQLKGIIADMKGDLEGILNFIEKLGFYLDDHYMYVRDTVRSV